MHIVLGVSMLLLTWISVMPFASPGPLADCHFCNAELPVSRWHLAAVICMHAWWKHTAWILPILDFCLVHVLSYDKSPGTLKLAIHPCIWELSWVCGEGFDSWFGLLMQLSLTGWPSWLSIIVSRSFRLLTEWVVQEDLWSGELAEGMFSCLYSRSCYRMCNPNVFSTATGRHIY